MNFGVQASGGQAEEITMALEILKGLEMADVALKLGLRTAGISFT